MEGWNKSPVVHLRLKNQKLGRNAQRALLQKVVEIARDKGVAVVCPEYVTQEEFYLPPPSIRLVSSISCVCVLLFNYPMLSLPLSHAVSTPHVAMKMTNTV